MEFVANLEIYLQEIMRNVAASLMAPVMVVLVFLILFSLYSIGSLVAEFFIERRHFKANMPRDINAIKDAAIEDLPAVIERTGLLRKQKNALKTIAANITLPEDDLFALAKSEVTGTDERYRRKVARTELVTKIAPMMGLMCTLIPLGPGIVAMGQGEVNLLSNSLLVAFDGTVAGLIGGVVSMCVSAVRKRWYASYLLATESLATCVLQKAEEARTATPATTTATTTPVMMEAPSTAPATTAPAPTLVSSAAMPAASSAAMPSATTPSTMSAGSMPFPTLDDAAFSQAPFGSALPTMDYATMPAANAGPAPVLVQVSTGAPTGQVTGQATGMAPQYYAPQTNASASSTSSWYAPSRTVAGGHMPAAQQNAEVPR